VYSWDPPLFAGRLLPVDERTAVTAASLHIPVLYLHRFSGVVDLLI